MSNITTIDTILFDLDGTLLPMDDERFIELYYDGMAIVGQPYGLTRQYLYDVVEEAFVTMMHNDGSMTNQELFFSRMKENAGPNYDLILKIFHRFSDVEFDTVRQCTDCNPMAGQWIRTLRDKGYRLILATNPLFPARCTRRRVQWAGMDPEDFDLITSYEDYCYAKPSREYFEEVMNRCGIIPSQCMMVGNDVREDMVAADLGMCVYLLKNNMINSRNMDFSMYPQGYYRDFTNVVAELPAL